MCVDYNVMSGSNLFFGEHPGGGGIYVAIVVASTSMGFFFKVLKLYVIRAISALFN